MASEVSYLTSDEWKDIVPIPQDDGPQPVVPIAYTKRFIEVMDYFRAIVKKDERSERALALTNDVIQENAANYTAWMFRRQCLEALKSDLEAELKWCQNVAEDNPKNYQLWYHRRQLVEKLGNPGYELEHTASVLAKDAKNYHAWTHRQWTLRYFKCWENEIAYVDTLLEVDVRNNSAWNQRHWVITNTGGFTAPVAERELKFTMDAIRRAPNNESSWNYFSALTGEVAVTKAQIDIAINFAKDVFKDVKCSSALSLLVDVYDRSPRDPIYTSAAIDVCQQLSSSVDTIRAKYWTWRQQSFQERLATINGASASASASTSASASSTSSTPTAATAAAATTST